jgi:hypothetical protein
MYTMVMMMAMSGSTDTANFGGKLFGRGNSCHGNSCQGAMVVSAGCSGSYAAPTVPAPAYTGCSGTSCHGSMSCHGGNGGGGFLGLRGRMGNRSGCHGSTSCSGYIVPSTGYHAPAADCCGTTAAYSTGCVGSIITGSTPGAVITETPATGAKEMPKVKDAPKGGTVPPTTTKSRDGV